MCYQPIFNYLYYFKDVDVLKFGLSDSQVRQLVQLKRAAREPLYAQIKEKEKRRSELLSSGISADSPAVVQLVSDISKLWEQVARTSVTRPPRDLALAVLDEAQRAKVAAFETALQLASEAIDLGLIPDTTKGEVLCH